MKELSTNQKPKLLVDWATFDQAKYACKNFHYSKCFPKSKQNKIGVWEDGKFIGVVMVGNSSGNTVFDFLGLNQITGAELTRVALNKHKTPVSKIISLAMRMVHKFNPGLLAIVSFADANQGHVGTIYQAGNWKYFGRTKEARQWFFRGKWRNDMKLREFFKGQRDRMKELPTRKIEGKHKYVYFFDKSLELKFKDQFKEYPKKRADSVATSTLPDQGERGSLILTSALQLET